MLAKLPLYGQNGTHQLPALTSSFLGNRITLFQLSLSKMSAHILLVPTPFGPHFLFLANLMVSVRAMWHLDEQWVKQLKFKRKLQYFSEICIMGLEIRMFLSSSAFTKLKNAFLYTRNPLLGSSEIYFGKCILRKDTTL